MSGAPLEREPSAEGVDEIRVFHHDDLAYEEWVERNGGYVLTRSTGGPPGFMLHKSNCGHLGRDGDLTLQLTKKPRRWAMERQTLVEWTEEQTGQRPLLCQTCL